ncbi:MAG: DUF2269 family protein [Dehalococcoidia bacterium]
MYTVLKFLHVLAAVAWVGGGLTLTILAEQVRAHGTPEEMTALLGRFEWFGKRFFSPLAVVVLLMGLGMAGIGGLMAAPWVSLGFLGIFASAGIGMGYLTPKGRQISALLEQHGPAHPEVVALTSRMLTASRIDLVILVAVVAVMVFKPGAV